jgi:hypothetical protein
VRLLLDRDDSRCFANEGISKPKPVSMFEIPPCSRTSGRPLPWTS